MAPLKPTKKDAPEKRVQTIIDKGKQISTLLNQHDTVPEDLLSDVSDLVKNKFPSALKNPSLEMLSGLESSGSVIWNTSTNIIRNAQAHDKDRVLEEYSAHTGVILRTFAFMLLDIVYQSSPKRQKEQDRLIRNLKVGIKACSSCLEGGELDLASNTIQKCAQYIASANEESPLVQLTATEDKSESRAILKELATQLHLLRLSHASRIERLDLADHFYQELADSFPKNCAHLAENATEILHKVGKLLLAQNLERVAVKWFQRALTALDSCDITQLSQDAFEARLTVSVSLVNCLVANGSTESLQGAQKVIDELELSHGFGNRMALQLLQLKVIFASGHIDEAGLNKVVERIVRSAVLLEHTFVTVTKAINRVSKISHTVACRALGDLITSRLLPEAITAGEPDPVILTWVEKSCVTYTLLVTKDSHREQYVTVDWLYNVFDATVVVMKGKFPARGTHAIQALLYKASATKESGIEDKWIRMLCHPLLSNAGHANKAKIGRKAMNAAITKGDFDVAREAFFQMSETAQNESITRYLSFQLALQTNDIHLAMESLKQVMRKAEHDPQFLYGCVLEAQQSRMRHLAVAALLAILETVPPNVHFASLLRCTAKLLLGELENPERGLDEVMEQTLRVFESASANTPALLQGTGDQQRAELQWWTKNAYNTALKYCAEMHPEHLVLMLRVCTQFMEFYPRDNGAMHDDDLQRRALLCHYLAATAFIVLARSNQDESEERLQSYLEARNEIANFISMCSKVTPDNDNDKNKTMRRLFDMLNFDLECVMNLRQWEKLDNVLQSCLQLSGIDRWDALADIALTIQAKLSTIEVDSKIHTRLTELLQQVINDTWKKERDVAKVARWLRISFSQDLNDGNGSFALDLLGQAVGMAKKGYSGKTDPFPAMELQWLSTTAFNKAVDLLSQGDGASCGPWLDGALELARWSSDNGSLHAALTHKRQMFDERLKDMS